jgi:hypothetical protein
VSGPLEQQSREDPMAFETLTVHKDGGVLLAEIAAPPINLLGSELVRDLVSLIQPAEAEAIQLLVFKSADPDTFISYVDVTRDRGVPGGGGEADRRSVDRSPVPPLERKSPGHDRADRGSRGCRRQRVRAGMRHAFRRARISDLRSVRARVRPAPRRRRRATSDAAHGPRPHARGHVECGGLLRGTRREVRLAQPSVCPPTSSAISSAGSLIGPPSVWQPPSADGTGEGSC